MNAIPLFPLNAVLFPGGPLGLRIFETRYIDMVRRCLRESRGFGVVLIRSGREAGPAEFADIGTYAKIVDFHQLADGLLGLSCVGERRLRILARARQADGLNLGEVEWLAPDPQVELPQRHAQLADLLRTVLPQLGDAYAGIDLHLADAAWVGYRLAEILPLDPADKQRCLELDDPLQRLDVLAPLLHAAGATLSGEAGPASH
ncbi:MAG TPA: LON peptidase substrate-binding domain-containing protein [Steroidobacteraceae bacterium]|nr:LON peptidase substrate-binding domain-containing protein [Steroidobacteraceae bacterium]